MNPDPTMDYRELAQSMTPDLYRRLSRAVELGKWPDGSALTAEQRESALQAIILWGQHNLDESQRIGYIDRGHKAGDSCASPEETPLNWK